MNRHNQIWRKLLLLVSAILMILLAGISGYFIGQKSVRAEHSAKNENTPHLNISALVDENAGFTNICMEQNNDDYFGDISYYNLMNVSIEIDQESIRLEKALEQQLISVEEIFAYARLDAQNGFCTETANSKNGLASFIYEYPEYTLELVYDVYETPDFERYIINDMKLYPKGSEIHTLYTYEENGERIDKEDWGLFFKIDQADATGISILCSQSGGQQIGELMIESFDIVHTEDWEYIPKMNQDTSTKSFEPISINMNSDTYIKFDWLNCYGSLKKGTYYIVLQIHDIYDATSVHPLMRNYYDTQYYQIEFAIP